MTLTCGLHCWLSVLIQGTSEDIVILLYYELGL